MRVLGLGDNVVDQYLDQNVMYPGGNSLNFSVYAKELGIDASYLGVFGNDRAADHIMETMKELKIDISRCRQHEGENGFASVDLVNGDRVFVGSNKGGVQKIHPVRLNDADKEYIKNFRLVHSSIYSEMNEEIQYVKETGVPVSFDFSSEYTDQLLVSVCEYVDYSLLSCGHLEEGDVKSLLKKVIQYGSKLAIGTMGSKGAIVFDGRTYYHQAPHFVEPVDTLGAGDSFFTAFIIHYLQGKGIQESLEAGAQFAAIKCLVNGAFGYGIPIHSDCQLEEDSKSII